MLSLEEVTTFEFDTPQVALLREMLHHLTPMKIVSLNIGQVETQIYFGTKTVQTAGHKCPTTKAVLHLEGFEGDAQQDRENHGGEDKAACVYSFDHYAYWEEKLGTKLAPAAFGENLTIAGIRESEICLGDILRVGETLTQVTQPRVPCSKLAGKLGSKKLPDLIHETSFSGFYLRVLSEGAVNQGDPVELVTRHSGGVTVEWANQVLYRQRDDRASLEKVLSVDALSASWRAMLSKRL